jgi:hypothetical protein
MKTALAIGLILTALTLPGHSAAAQSRPTVSALPTARPGAPPATDAALSGTKTIPAAPTDLNVVSSTTTSVTLTWTLNSSDATAIHVEFATAGSSFTELPGSPVTGNSTGAIVNNLTPGTIYMFRVRASNVDGFSSYSNTVTFPGGAVVSVPTLSALSAALLVALLAVLGTVALRT